METRKLYYEDPFQKGFATTVVSCDAVKGGYAVVLAETAFYPEGGGQPYDTGVLGGVEVDDPTGLPLIEQLAGIGEVDTSGITASESPAAPEAPTAP